MGRAAPAPPVPSILLVAGPGPPRRSRTSYLPPPEAPRLLHALHLGDHGLDHPVRNGLQLHPGVLLAEPTAILLDLALRDQLLLVEVRVRLRAAERVR